MGRTARRLCVLWGVLLVSGGIFVVVSATMAPPRNPKVVAPNALGANETAGSSESTAPGSSASEVADVFIFAAPEHQGMVGPRSGQIFLNVTDLSIKAGTVELPLQRWLETDPESTIEGLVGTRWRLNWEITLDHCGTMALLNDGEGPVLLTADASEDVFRSPTGGKLTVGKEHSTYKRIDGTADVFDEHGRLVRRKMRGGDEFVLTYDEEKRLRRVDGPHGSFLQFVFDKTGRVTRVVGSNGSSVQYHYRDGALAGVVSDRTGSVTYRYNEEGLLREIGHLGFGRLTYQYDDRGRVLSRRWIDGTEESWSYDDRNRTVRHTAPTGAVTTYRTSADGRREEVVDFSGYKTNLVYNERGQLARVTGPTGQTVTNKYDELGRMVRIETPRVGAVELKYEGEDRVPVSVTGPSGRLSFEYDLEQNLVGIDGAGARGVSFEYGPANRIQKVQSCNGRDVFFTHDDRGRVKTVAYAPDFATEFEYDTAGNLVREKDPAGGITSRTYDEAGRLTSVRYPDGATTQYRYSPGGLLEEVVGPSGGITRYRYRGRTIEVTDSADRTTRYTHDAAARLKQITQSNGARSCFGYDAAGNLVRTVAPSGGVTTRDYDALGRLLEETSPGGGMTRYEYDDAGRLARVVGPAGQSEDYKYNGNGRLMAVSDGVGHETRYEYDDAGHVVRLIDPVGRETRYEYSACGLATKIVPPEGPATELVYHGSGSVAEVKRGDYVLTYEHNALGQPVKEWRSDGLQVDYRYDPLGNLTEWNDNLGGQQNLRYDRRGRLTESVDSNGGVTRLRYDLAGNLLGVTDPRGQVKRYRYSKVDELSEVVEPNGDTAKYAYDEAGNLTMARHPGGGKTQYDYDESGNLLKASDPLGNSAQSSYDTAGLLASTTDAIGRQTTYAYDAAGRLIQKRLPNGNVVRYRYDEAGNVAEVDDGLYPVRYQYDFLGNTTQVEYPAIDKSLQYEYDPRGRLTKFIDPEGQAVTYAYDELDRLASLQTGDGKTVSFTYDAKDRLSGRSYPNGVNGTWKYDGEDRIVEICFTDSAGNVVSLWKYQYDAAGNPVEVVDAEGKTTRYEYDEAGQLVSETSPDGKEVNYTYAPGGNRATKEVDGQVISYRYDEADRVLEAGDETFAYDANGNLVERGSPEGTTHYEYDTEDRLVRVRSPGGEEVRFGYAPTGERIWREDSSGKTHYLTDGTNLLAELDDDLQPKATYHHGPEIDQPLLMRSGVETYAYQVDAIGTVTGLTDSAGRVAASYTTDAFGNVLAQTGNVPNSFIFTGREYEPSLKLYYYRARWYHPSSGRFLSRDPHPPTLTEPLTLNRYAYALNVPTRYTDPFGLEADGVNSSLGVQHIEFGPRFQGFMNSFGNSPAPGIAPSNSPGGDLPLMTSIRGGPSARFVSGAGPVSSTAAPTRPMLPAAPTRPMLPATPTRPMLPAAPTRPMLPATPTRPMLPATPTRPMLAPATTPAVPSVRSATSHVGHGFTGLSIGANFGACLAEGNGINHCVNEAHTNATWSAVSAGVGIIAGAAAVAYLPPAAVTTVAVAGTAYSGYGAWQSGMRWAQAPTVVAERRQREIQAQMLSRFGTLQQAVLEQIADLEVQARQIPRKYAEAQEHLGEVLAAGENTSNAYAALVRAQKAVLKAEAECQRGNLAAVQAVIDAYAENGEDNQEMVGRSVAPVESEATVFLHFPPSDPNAGRRLQQSILKKFGAAETQSRDFITKISELLVQAKEKNATLEAIRNAASRAKQTAKEARALARQVADASEEIDPLRKEAEAAALELRSFLEDFESGRRRLKRIIGTLRTFVPKDDSPNTLAMRASVDALSERLLQVKGGDVEPKTIIERAQAAAYAANKLAVEADVIVDQLAIAVLRDELDLADESIARIEEARGRARARLETSLELRDKVAAWAPDPDITTGITDAGPVTSEDAGEPDIMTGITDAGPASGGDEDEPDIMSGITDAGPARGNADIDEPGMIDGITDAGPADDGRPTDRERTPRRPTSRTSESSRTPTAGDEPLYAVYGIHSCSLPKIPADILNGAANDNGYVKLAHWVHRLSTADVSPSAKPVSYLVFKVEGDVLAEYQRHQQAFQAGRTRDPYWLFKPEARYHMNVTIRGSGSQTRAPMLLSFHKLASGTLPAAYQHARIRLFAADLATLKNPRLLSSRQSLGGGWRFEGGLGDEKMTCNVGPLEHDHDNRWQKQTLDEVLALGKMAVLAGVGAGAAFGDAFEGFGGGVF